MSKMSQENLRAITQHRIVKGGGLTSLFSGIWLSLLGNSQFYFGLCVGCHWGDRLADSYYPQCYQFAWYSLGLHSLFFSRSYYPLGISLGHPSRWRRSIFHRGNLSPHSKN